MKYIAYFRTRDKSLEQKFSNLKEAEEWLFKLEVTHCDEWVVENRIKFVTA